MRVKKTAVPKRASVGLGFEQKIHYDPHLDVYWISMTTGAGEIVSSPFSQNALDDLYNDAWSGNKS